MFTYDVENPNRTDYRRNIFLNGMSWIISERTEGMLQKIGTNDLRVFDNGSEDRGLIPDRVIPNTLKMVLDATLLSTQHYKVRIKGKVEQSSE